MVVKAAISLALFYGIEKFSSARKHTSYGHCLHFWNIFVMTIKAIQAFKISQFYWLHKTKYAIQPTITNTNSS